MYVQIFHLPPTVLAQVEIAEREQELIKGIELVRQKMVESTAKAAQRIIELNDELAELEVAKNFPLHVNKRGKEKLIKMSKTIERWGVGLNENYLFFLRF